MKNILSILLLLNIILFSGCTKDDSNIKVTLIIPSSTIYNDHEFQVGVEIESNIDVNKVDFYFDNNLIGSVSSAPYIIKYTPKDEELGPHVLSYIVDYKNSKNSQTSTSGSCTFTLELYPEDK